jgi:hypothetical protein
MESSTEARDDAGKVGAVVFNEFGPTESSDEHDKGTGMDSADDDSDDSGKRKNRMTRTGTGKSNLSSFTLSRSMSSWSVEDAVTNASMCCPFLSSCRKRRNDDSSSEDEEDGIQEDPRLRASQTGRNRPKKVINWKAMIFGTSIEEQRRRQVRLKALENLQLREIRDLERHGLLTRRDSFEDKTGLRELRIRVEMKRVLVRESPPTSLTKAVDNKMFELLVAAMLVTNCIQIGAQTYHDEDHMPAGLVVMEHMFVVFFLTELGLRLARHSWAWLFNTWNSVDVMIILVTGVLTSWILAPLNVDGGILAQGGALRILRLVRLIRSVRIFPLFSSLWMLVSGIISSLNLLFWAFILLGFLHFIFAIAVLDVIAKSDTFQSDEQVQRYFGSLSAGMLTLFQTMTFDSWGDKVFPILFGMPGAGMLIFTLFIGVCGIVLSNILVAIVVFKAMNAKECDEEAKAFWMKVSQQSKQQELLKIFKSMDEDGNGELDREEFLDILGDVSFMTKMRQLDIDLAELPDVFDILDDGDGRLTAFEFCSGLQRMQGTAKAKETFNASHQMEIRRKESESLLYGLDCCMDEDVLVTESSLLRSSQNLAEAQMMTAEIFEALNHLGTQRVFLGTVHELPIDIEKPDMDGLVKTDAAARRRDAEGMKDKPLPGALELPPQSWATEYLDNKAKGAKRKAAGDKKHRILAKDKSVAQDETATVPKADTSDAAHLRAASKTGVPSQKIGWPLTPVKESGEDEEDEDLGNVAAEFQLQWSELGLGPSTWNKSRLRAAADAAMDYSKLTLPHELLVSTSSLMNKMQAEHDPAGPPSRSASRAASRASRRRSIDDGKVNLALGWSTRAIASRASSRASNRAIANKPAGAMRKGSGDSVV